jgi:cytochrome P450
VEAKLHTEIDTVLAGRLPTVENLSRLQYAKMVFAEAMRLYPPVGRIGRRVLDDYRVGAYVVPANAIIFISPYVMHHDPRYFPDPFVFEPQRWTVAAQAERPKFAYFPFGGGVRQCIGEPLVWMAGVLLIAAIAQQWQMRLVPGHPVAIQPLTTLRPRYGLRMQLKRRIYH